MNKVRKIHQKLLSLGYSEERIRRHFKFVYRIRNHKCKHCGKEFRGHRNTYHDVFCSIKCVGDYKRKPLVSYVCPYCNKPFKGNSIFCSKICCHLSRNKTKINEELFIKQKINSLINDSKDTLPDFIKNLLQKEEVMKILRNICF